MPLKKATLLFEEDIYEKLREKSLIDNVSIGELVREAVSVYYGIRNTEDKLEALNKLKSMKLPVGSPELIEQQILNGQDLERFE
ncbi:MAG: hypothetical protein L6405_00750 [Actinomycetia bacterium]|jgi:hypothetical protein|nr:hypothetical protein [Actinomycetota bacterium]MCG2788466.1 hypothetical protein [Actinomycetes bacterium]